MLIIYLDKTLKVYSFKKTNLELLDLILTENKYLNLSEKFEFFWEDLWEDFLKLETEILYLIGPNAGFSDSRVVFVWLKMWQELNMNLSENLESKINSNLLFFVDKLENSLELENLSQFLLNSLITKAKSKNCQKLLYTKEPSFG